MTIIQCLSTADTDIFTCLLVHCATVLDIKQMQWRRRHMTARRL